MKASDAAHTPGFGRRGEFLEKHSGLVHDYSHASWHPLVTQQLGTISRLWTRRRRRRKRSY